MVWREATADWKLVTSETKELAAVDMVVIDDITLLIVVYMLPTKPPVVELPSAVGKSEVMVPVGEAEFKGVL